jgi:copper chaperone CopZ
MENIKIVIPTMITSQELLKVDKAIQKLPGATLEEVSPGYARVELDGASRDLVLHEIKKVGHQGSIEGSGNQ